MPKGREKSSHKGETLLKYSPMALHQAVLTYTHETATSTGRRRRGYKVRLN